MATPTEIANLIAQAWELDPEENFFEFLFDVFQTNATLFALGEVTHDQIQEALNTYIAAGGAPLESDSTGDSGDPQGNPTG